jgi:imidazolonepropionase-like amidohydrolase
MKKPPKNNVPLLLTLLALFGPLANAETPAVEHTEITVLKAARLLDVHTGKLVSPAMIRIENGKITATGSTLSAPEHVRTIDLGDVTLLPGLIDVHTHLTVDPYAGSFENFLGKSVPAQALTGYANGIKTLQAGFTAVRNVGAGNYADLALRDAIEAGDVQGPHVQAASLFIGMSGGHCDTNLLAPEFAHHDSGIADGPWAVRAKVREAVKYGVDVIKFCASGGVMTKGDLPGTQEYTFEEMQALTDEAHKLGRRVAAHAHGIEAIKAAIRAGADSIEHASLIDDEGIALAKKHGTYLAMDIYNDDFIVAEGEKAGISKESLEKEKMVAQAQRDNFRKAVKAGAKMAFGSDAGIYPHGDNAKQFVRMVEYGMSPLQAIQSATLNAAALMGKSADYGALSPGLQADIIAVPGNPLSDVKLLQQVRFVMKGGVVVKQ